MSGATAPHALNLALVFDPSEPTTSSTVGAPTFSGEAIVSSPNAEASVTPWETVWYPASVLTSEIQ